MLPKLTLDQLTQKVEQSRYLVDATVQPPVVKSKAKLPIIPPRSSEKDLYLTESNDAVWYMVLSPREVRGVAGKGSSMCLLLTHDVIYLLMSSYDMHVLVT